MTTDNQSMNVQEALLKERIDPCLTHATLSSLITEALNSKTRCAGYTVLTGGCWNRVIAVTADGGKKRLVIKITPKTQDTNLKREYDVLRYFREHTAMPVPEPYLLDLSGNRIPGSVLVMAQVPGKVLSAVRATLNGDERRSISVEIASHLVDLHTRVDVGFGAVEARAEERSTAWADFWVPRYDIAVTEAQEKGLLSDEILNGLSELRRCLPKLLDIGPRGTLTHYDIWTGNVMVDRVGDRIRVSGFLDVLGYYADYARELSSMFTLADEPLIEAYRVRHGLDETFYARFNVYAMKMCMQLVAMYPSEQRYVDDTRQFLRKVMTCCEAE